MRNKKKKQKEVVKELIIEERKPADFLWKIVLCGDAYVGKTSIRKKAMGAHFTEDYIPTVGADFSSYKIKFGDLNIGFQVWDLAGQDKYKYIRSSFYGGATGCFLVFDVTNPKSLPNLASWVDEAIRFSSGGIEILVLCGNKVDLVEERKISREMGEDYLEALRESSGLQCEYIETSALTGENIASAFALMANCMLDRERISPQETEEFEEVPTIAEKMREEEKQAKDLLEKTAEEEATVGIVSTQEMPESAKEPVSSAETIMLRVITDEEEEDDTSKLIAEVMEILSDTEQESAGLIIGRELTNEGEKAVTVPKDSIALRVSDEDEPPQISPSLEKVLLQINTKLDGLAERLASLEKEIDFTRGKDLGLSKEQVEEEIKELEEELGEAIEIDTRIPSIEQMPTQLEEGREEDEEASGIIIKETVGDEREEGLEEELVEILDEELREIPEEEPLILIEESEIDEKMEEAFVDEAKIDEASEPDLSSAMISELKAITKSEELERKEEPQQQITTDEIFQSSLEELVTEETEQPQRVLTEETEKRSCPICGREVKFIRQYQKYYCVSCGRYVI